MNSREQSPIYQTRSTRVLHLKDIRREGRGPRVALAVAGLLALIAVATVIGQGLNAARPAAVTATADTGAARERVLSELSEGAPAGAAAHPAPTAPSQAEPTAAAPAVLRVSGTDGSGLRLRPVPGLAGEPVAVLPEGAAVTPTGRTAAADGLTWAEVSAEGGITGWAAADYLR